MIVAFAGPITDTGVEPTFGGHFPVPANDNFIPLPFGAGNDKDFRPTVTIMLDDPNEVILSDRPCSLETIYLGHFHLSLSISLQSYNEMSILSIGKGD
jgi:hypothetical protein